MDSEEAAELISLMFNAPIVASFTFLSLLFFEQPPSFTQIIVITLTFGTIVPLVTIYYLSKQGIIPDVYASQKESRAIPFVGAILSYIIGAIVLVLTGAPPIATALMLCYFGNSLIMMLVSSKWKISVHASGITGPATVLIYALGVSGFLLMLLVIPVGWARIRLHAHTLGQVLAGALLTVATTWLQLEVYLMLL